MKSVLLTSPLSYRKDIDGLRGLAVLFVVLFHAGISIFEGGFIGVDIFFVISGFLITSIINKEIRHERFSIVSFYERRIRRIFPALFFIIFLSSIAAFFILPPRSFKDFAQSLIAGTLFASNFLFWSETGYFDSAAATKPLLHTWSLAVEEQFYIFFPILLLCIIRWFVGLEKPILFLLTGISLGLSILYVEESPSATFYLPHGRAWELLLGAYLVYASFPILSHRVTREIIAALGMSLIIWGMVSFTKQTPFPGFNALFPCLGAMLIIFSGRYGTSIVGEILSSKPIVFLGLLSYSLYLWHWPLFVFYKEYWIDVSLMENAIVMSFALLISFFSWQFIEKPFRKHRGILNRSGIFVGAGILLVSTMSFGLWGHFSNGWPQRFPPQVREIFNKVKPGNPRQKDCLGKTYKFVSVEDACVYGANVVPSFVVWGDSHADSLIGMIGKKLESKNQSAKFFGAMACPPIVGLKQTIISKNKCLEFNKQVLEVIENTSEIQSVIMIARYSAYIYGRSFNLGPAEENKKHQFITDEFGLIQSENDRKTFFKERFFWTIDRLVKAGKKVVLVYPIPETGYHIPNTLRQLVLKDRKPETFTRPYDYYQKRQLFIFELFVKLRNNDLVVHIFPHEQLCNGEECIVFAQDHLLYFDDNHLSFFGAKYVMPAFDVMFKKSE